MDVDEVGPSLRYATAKVNRTQRGTSGGGGFSGGGQGGGQAEDPWATGPSSPSNTPQSGGGSVRSKLAKAFNLDEDHVHVFMPDTGSAYGGKHSGECAVEAARLAKGAGKPVKLIWTREEEFTWAYLRPAGVIDVKSGIASDGTLSAWEFITTSPVLPGSRRPMRSPISALNITRSNRLCAKGLIEGWQQRRIISRANHTWTN